MDKAREAKYSETVLPKKIINLKVINYKTENNLAQINVFGLK